MKYAPPPCSAASARKDIEKTLGKVFLHPPEGKWNNIPFEVVNDGEVTALAGAMGMNDNAVLGVAMGTSEARPATWIRKATSSPG